MRRDGACVDKCPMISSSNSCGRFIMTLRNAVTETGVGNVKLEDGDRTLEFTHLWLSSPKQSGMLVRGLRDSGGIWDTDAGMLMRCSGSWLGIGRTSHATSVWRILFLTHATGSPLHNRITCPVFRLSNTTRHKNDPERRKTMVIEYNRC